MLLVLIRKQKAMFFKVNTSLNSPPEHLNIMLTQNRYAFAKLWFELNILPWKIANSSTFYFEFKARWWHFSSVPLRGNFAVFVQFQRRLWLKSMTGLLRRSGMQFWKYEFIFSCPNRTVVLTHTKVFETKMWQPAKGQIMLEWIYEVIDFPN